MQILLLGDGDKIVRFLANRLIWDIYDPDEPRIPAYRKRWSDSDFIKAKRVGLS